MLANKVKILKENADNWIVQNDIHTAKTWRQSKYLGWLSVVFEFRRANFRYN